MPYHRSPATKIDPQLAEVQQIVAKVQRRQRGIRVIYSTLQVALPLGLILAALILMFVRLSGFSVQWVWLATLPTVLIGLIAWLRPLAQRKSIRLIDQHYRLHDLIGNTVELASVVPLAKSTPDSPEQHRDREHRIPGHALNEMVEQVRQTVPKLQAREVVPLTYPSLRKLDVLGFIFLALATQLPGPATDDSANLQPSIDSTSAQKQARGHQPEDSSSADEKNKQVPKLPLSNLIQEELRELSQGDDPFASQALEILKGLETNELSLAQALKQLEELSKKIETDLHQIDQELPEDPTLINEALRDLRETWRSQPALSKTARSMTSKDMESGLEALEQALSSETAPNNREQALAAGEKSLSRSIRRKTSTSKELAEAERRIRRKQKPQESNQEHQRRLKRQQETIERLKRQKKREQAARQELEKLRRLSKNSRRRDSRSRSNQARKKLSESMKQLVRRHQKPKRRQRVQEIIEETKAMIRRSSRKDQPKNRRQQQRQRFDQMASGKKDSADQTTLYVESERQLPQNNGPQIEDDRPGGDADSDQSSSQPGQDPRDSSGENNGPSDGIGDGSESNQSQSEAKNKKFRSRSRHLQGQTTKGTSRAEIIETSSQSGFAKQSYRNVYQDYHSFAQSVMDRENLPESQRSLVHRYFRLISPRQSPPNKDEEP